MEVQLSVCGGFWKSMREVHTLDADQLSFTLRLALLTLGQGWRCTFGVRTVYAVMRRTIPGSACAGVRDSVRSVPAHVYMSEYNVSCLIE